MSILYEYSEIAMILEHISEWYGNIHRFPNLNLPQPKGSTIYMYIYNYVRWLTYFYKNFEIMITNKAFQHPF